jgi:hypothetical protein
LPVERENICSSRIIVSGAGHGQSLALKTRRNVAVIGGAGYDRIVAKSFSGFVRKYISDWRSVSPQPSKTSLLK